MVYPLSPRSAHRTPLREFLRLRKEQEGSNETARQNPKESTKWQALLSPWHELKAELLQQQAALRVEHSAALVDFALDKTPENRAKLDDLNTHLATIDVALRDVEVTLAEAKRQAAQAARVLPAVPQKTPRLTPRERDTDWK